MLSFVSTERLTKRKGIPLSKTKRQIINLSIRVLVLMIVCALNPAFAFDFSNFSSVNQNLTLEKITAGPMTPHKYNATPFMEGWYTRITHGKERIAIIVGYYESEDSTKQGYAAILTAKDGKLVVDEAFSSDFEIDHGDSNLFSSDFEVKLGNFAYIKKDYLSIRLPSGASLEANFSKISPWKPISLGLGPESIGVFMPFKAHWYVHSLNSRVRFHYSNPQLNINMYGIGSAHQEKNWGQAFPSG